MLALAAFWHTYILGIKIRCAFPNWMISINCFISPVIQHPPTLNCSPGDYFEEGVMGKEEAGVRRKTHGGSSAGVGVYENLCAE